MRGLPQPGGAVVGLRAPLWLVPVALALAACLPAQARAAVVKTEPSVRPGFKRALTDYVVRCPDRSLTVRVRRGRGTKVKVAGRRTRKKRTVAIEPGQARRIVVRKHGRVTRHFVRCLPDYFPRWRYRARGPQKPRWYLMTPNHTLTPTSVARPADQLVAIFNHHGVPVWWYRSPAGGWVRDARLIGGNIAFAETGSGRGFARFDSDAYRILRPDGSLVRTIRAVGSPTDFHDIKRLGRDFLVVTYRPRPDVDLSAYGGPSDATVVDSEIQRINPRGRVVWSWNSSDHIGLAETGRMWDVVNQGEAMPDGSKVYDPTHINSVEPVGRGDLIISLRNTDAVYRIRMRDGRIRWKLGGTRTPRSLRVVGDPADYPLGAQHDARVWRGTVSVFDNSWLLDRRPRVVRYEIDMKRRRAILRERVTSRRVPGPSTCCGNARKLGNGDWVIGWGFTSMMEVRDRRGALLNRLRFDDEFFSYRSVPAPARAVSAASLRAGMNALYEAAGEAD